MAQGPVGRFPPGQRVRKRSEFQEIQARARRVSTPSFVLLLYARPEATGARLGTVASRKTGNAAVRNRAKRLIREAFRATRSLWEPDLDLVVIAKRPLCDAGLGDVLAEWRGAEPAIRARVAEARKDGEKRRLGLAKAAEDAHTRPESS